MIKIVSPSQLARDSYFLTVFDQVDWTPKDNEYFLSISNDREILNVNGPVLPERQQYTTRLDLGQSNLPCTTYSRARGPPAIEWERLRPVILQLYIDEERPLEDVMHKMKEQHDFYATVQMYKKRFASWKCRKNYSRQQKEEVILLQDSNILPPTDGSAVDTPIVLNNKRLKQHRIERYRRQRLRRPGGHSRSQPSHLHLQQSPEAHSLETILVEIGYYNNWCLSQPDLNARLRPSVRASEVSQCIAFGVSSLDKDPRQAFALLNKGCSNIPGLLQEQNLPPIYHLLSLCGYEQYWHGHADARLALLRYISAMARHVLGPLHPVSRILSLLHGNHSATNLLQLAGRLLFDNMAGIDKGRIGYQVTERVLDFQIYIVSILYTDSGALDLAAKEILRIMREIRAMFPQPRWLLQQARYKFACINDGRGDHRSAEIEWLLVISSCLYEQGREIVSSASVRSCNSLGRLYQRQGRIADAEHYFRLALDGALRIWSAEDPATFKILENLENFLEDTGRRAEATELHQFYLDAFSSLEGYCLKQEYKELETGEQVSHEDNT